MNSKKINITIPEDNLEEIEEFCHAEGVSKSFLIREASIAYISKIKEERQLQKKREEMQWTVNATKKLRDKSTGFKEGKKGLQVIRQSRDGKL
ncbi:MAG: ribbon-helix-helix protein, CopG family [Actinobacteria bacterium]|nr:ribbon-helix-helix protein, CopG family [Actinomycetota bacterium]MBM3712705.1 ribbon-helix-helix protein, CopG family [Actinomycetota bacterium]